MKIYTKKGDQGETGLLGGSRVPKFHLRIESYGTIDELNSQLGLLRDQMGAMPQIELLSQIQSQLFTIGSHLANDPENSHFALPGIELRWIQAMEDSMDEMNTTLPELKNFILPGGHPANSQAHIARCVCRRAERRTAELQTHTEMDAHILPYLNRLSDWLFVLSRTISLANGAEEILWKPGEPTS